MQSLVRFACVVFCLLEACSKKEITPQNIAPDPSADFLFSGDHKNAPDTVSFMNLSRNSAEYLWNFGDGGSSAQINAQHIYSSYGHFVVKLVAISEGKSDSISKSITILDPNLPTAAFTFSCDTENFPNTINFVNTSRNTDSYFWNFGDNTTSTDTSPSHGYTSDGGNFLVTLIAKGFGGSDTARQWIKVLPQPRFVYLDSISLDGVPATNHGNDWDVDGTGPDVYFIIEDALGLVFNDEVNRLNDITSSTLPFVWNTHLKFPKVHDNYVFSFYDYDTDSVSDIIGSVSFSPNDHGGTPFFPRKFKVSSNGLVVTLFLDWK